MQEFQAIGVPEVVENDPSGEPLNSTNFKLETMNFTETLVGQKIVPLVEEIIQSEYPNLLVTLQLKFLEIRLRDVSCYEEAEVVFEWEVTVPKDTGRWKNPETIAKRCTSVYKELYGGRIDCLADWPYPY